MYLYVPFSLSCLPYCWWEEGGCADQHTWRATGSEHSTKMPEPSAVRMEMRKEDWRPEGEGRERERERRERERGRGREEGRERERKVTVRF